MDGSPSSEGDERRTKYVDTYPEAAQSIRITFRWPWTVYIDNIHYSSQDGPKTTCNPQSEKNYVHIYIYIYIWKVHQISFPGNQTSSRSDHGAERRTEYVDISPEARQPNGMKFRRLPAVYIKNIFKWKWGIPKTTCKLQYEKNYVHIYIYIIIYEGGCLRMSTGYTHLVQFFSTSHMEAIEWKLIHIRCTSGSTDFRRAVESPGSTCNSS